MTSQASPELAAAGPPRRLRRWLWITLASSLLIALVAVPLWRYCWHQEYRRLLLSFSPSSRDSYHDVEESSLLGRLPQSWQVVFSPLRSVDIRANPKRSLTADDLRQLNRAVCFRQFGWGIESLGLEGVNAAAWDGLDGYFNLRSLQVQTDQLPADLGPRLKRHRLLTKIELGEALFKEGMNPLLDILSLNGESPRDRISRAFRNRRRKSSAAKQNLAAIETMWLATQLEHIILQSSGVLDLRHVDLRPLVNLHTLELYTGLAPTSLDQLADLPALRLLHLRNTTPDDKISLQAQQAEWEEKLIGFHHHKPRVLVSQPRHVTEYQTLRMLKTLKRDAKLDPQKNAPSSPKE